MPAIAAWFNSFMLAPVMLAFLGLIPVVVLLYILKLRRTEIVIPSTMLWLKSLQDVTANAPFQRLRKNLLLLLQILVLLALAFALARPFVKAEGMRGSNVAVVIDRSASMQTREDGGTRLDLAKEAALDMVDNLRGGDRMMVIAFAHTADVRTELTEDKYLLRQAIRGIEPSDAGTRIRDVVSVIRSLAPDNPDIPAAVTNLDVVLLSDGNLGDIDELGARMMSMRYARIGSNAENAGIVSLSTRRPEENSDELHQTLVAVYNDADEALETTLTLYFNGEPVAVEAVEAPARSERQVIFEHPDFGEGMLRAEIDTADALDVDNRAWLSVAPPETVRTLIVSAGDSSSDFFLRRALSLEPRVELSAIAPESYAPTGDFDLTIFDGFAPETLPEGTSVVINAVPTMDGLASIGELENPPVLSHDRNHPAMRLLNPANLGIAKAIQFSLPLGARPLLTTENGALMADVSRGGRQILIIGFDVAASDWPLRLSFPLFWQNVVTWASGLGGARAESIQAGTPLTVPPHPDALTADINGPGGIHALVDTQPLRPVYFGDTETTGVYTVQVGDTAREVAVNLLDRTESAVRPADEIRVGRGSFAAESAAGLQTREYWRWLVLAAVGILCGEWWLYVRRAWL